MTKGRIRWLMYRSWSNLLSKIWAKWVAKRKKDCCKQNGLSILSGKVKWITLRLEQELLSIPFTNTLFLDVECVIAQVVYFPRCYFLSHVVEWKLKKLNPNCGSSRACIFILQSSLEDYIELFIMYNSTTCTHDV